MTCDAKAQLFDDFSDGDFTQNPTWVGTTDNFIVNAQQRLQLNDTDPVLTQSYLAVPISATALDDVEWRFYIKQSFAGSDNNHSRIYLTSSQNQLIYSGNGSAGTEGYYLKMGEAGSADVIRFYRDNGSSTTLIASGTTSIASSVNMRIRITRAQSGMWQLGIDPSGGENFTPEMNFTETTYNTNAYMGIVCSYTSSNAQNFFFDDFYFGEIITDTTPPLILSATATGANTVDVLFNEPVLALSAENTGHYALNNGMGNPTTALRDAINPSLVHLTWSTDLVANQAYLLTVSNVEDENNNSMAEQSLPIIYHVYHQATFRDVVINEVLADPSPVAGLPNAEFLELHNTHSTHYFNLENWVLVNTNSPKTLPAFSLAPGGYVILCDASQAALFEPYGSVIGISSFIALANTADSLTLLDGQGILIDRLSYTDSWYATPAKREGGWSLEMINPLFPCQSSVNWSEAQHPEGGTPGSINSVYDNTPDTTPPQLTQVTITSNESIAITFSEAIDTTGLDFTQWSLLPFNSIVSGQWNNTLRMLTLNTDQSLFPPNTYTLMISDIRDCSGNTMPSTTHNFTIGFTPQAGDVVINEIMADPDPPRMMPNAEYIELRNNSSHLLDITALRLNSGVFTQQVLLEPDSVVVVTSLANASLFDSFSNVAFMTSFPGLTNSGMLLELKTVGGEVFDAVNYSDSWYKDESKKNGGWSLELINPHAPCSGGFNWMASIHPYGGTAGYPNSVYSDDPDENAPKFQWVSVVGNQGLMFFFDKPLGADFLDNIQLALDGVLLPAVNLQLGGPENNALAVNSVPMIPGQIHAWSLTGITDCWGNTSPAISGRIGLPQPAQPGDVLINELLYNPYEGGSDFVELFNASSKIISLNQWKIADATNGIMNTAKTIATIDYVLLPQEYLVLTRKPQSLTPYYAQTATDRVWTVADLPDFSATDEVFLLFGNDATLSDHLRYDSQMHYPLLSNTQGVSLERISPHRPTTDRTNWHSAAASVQYATPGYQNSQFTPMIQTDDVFHVSPEIFSPDNDGYEDIVNFAYELSESGFTGNLKIYDSEGRFVRHLMKNELLGTSGMTSWDGLNEENQKATVGIYILAFEAFHPKGDVVKSKKNCVLAIPLH